MMRPFLAARGRLAPDMMSMTASAQASFDFASERDAAEKLRVALAAQPAIVALCANSPVVGGAESGWQSFRTEVWNHTDPARCGILPFAFEPGFEEDAYRRYVEWVLDVPMVFLRRGGALPGHPAASPSAATSPRGWRAPRHARRLGGPALGGLPRGPHEGGHRGPGRRTRFLHPW